MSTLRILNRKGDTAVVWSPEKLATGDTEAKAAVQEAERMLAEAKAQGATAFRVLPDADAERLDTFDPTQKQDIVIVPRIAGDEAVQFGASADTVAGCVRATGKWTLGGECSLGL